jgi:hypothetical protein
MGGLAAYNLEIGGTAKMSMERPGGLTLISNLASPYVIVLGRDASPSEEFAAAELRATLYQISGCQLPLVRDDEVPERRDHMIIVGRCSKLASVGIHQDLNALGDEGFIVQTAGNSLAMAGGRLRGTMYAVYSFLEEHLGCRWYSSSASVIPRPDIVRVGAIDEEQRPAFEYREPFYFDAFDGDWAARNRSNGATARLDAKRGGRIRYQGFVHTFYPLVPPEKHFADHPEYYSLIDGRRTTERAQLCLTNPDVLRIVTEEVLRQMEDNPEATIFSVSQNDWFGACQCDACRSIDEEEGTHAGTLIRFVNAVAEVTAATFPDKYIDTLAYQYTENAPRYVRPHDRVIVRLCHMRPCCDSHPLSECPHNANYCRNLEQWTAITPKVYIWHYVTNFRHYLMPFPNFHAIGKDMAHYHRAGVAGMFCQGDYNSPGGELAELRAWVLAKLLWNPYQDIDPLIDDFLAGYYGPAAGYIRDYIDLLVSKVVADNIHMDLFCDPDVGYLTEEVRAEAVLLLREASLAATNDEMRYHVERIRLGVEYVDLWFKVHGASRWADVEPHCRGYVERVQQYGVQRLNEWQTFDQFLANLRRHLNQGTSPD